MKLLLFIVFLFACSTNAIAANEKVTKVYTCGSDVGIEVENIGWLVVLESQVGEKRVDRVLSVGLSLLATQAPIGYFAAGNAINWCGIANAKPITALQIKRL